MSPQRSTCLAGAMAACLMLGCATMAFVGSSTPHAAGNHDGPAQVNKRFLRGSELLAPAQEQAASSWPLKFGGAALSLLAALLVALMPAAEAQAAKMGGRMGGTASSQQRSKPPPPRAQAPSTTINRTTVVNKTVVVVPPAPVMVAPPVVMGPSVGDIIVGSVVSNAISNTMMPRVPTGTDQMLANQQRQDERQMDKQEAEFNRLRQEVQDMKLNAARN